MSKVLALLSGKGGSGKTTLALSIASMLSNCCLKVLLVDCDLSTMVQHISTRESCQKKQMNWDHFIKFL